MSSGCKNRFLMGSAGMGIALLLASRSIMAQMSI